MGDTWTAIPRLTVFDDGGDFSTEGRFSIGRHFGIWHNGLKDEVLEFSPGLSEDWKTGTDNLLLDTTRHGWTLAVKKSADTPPVTAKTMVGMPLFLETETPSQGLDAVSFTMNKSFNADLKGYKQEFWIMVPAGGNIPVRFRSGACQPTPVTLGGAQGSKVAASPASVNTQDTIVTFSAPADAAGTEEAVDIRLADQHSLSVPLRAKVMKPRVVQVSVWPINHPVTGAAPAIPTEQEFEDYLDDIYKKQINVTFDVTIQPPSASNLGPNDLFRVSDPPSPVQVTVATGKKAGNIQIYVMGGLNFLESTTPGKLPMTGLANPGEAYVWLADDNAASGTADERKSWLNTVAHEIGHVFFGEGHPNLPTPGPAPLSGTDDMVRLMHNGFGHVGSALIRRVCVKAEWDVAEEWLENEEANQRL